MQTLHVISHTHWDREWYLTFQQFRLKLVHLIDKLLDILDEDPEYRHFMLDGQTIVLDDYLQVRPEKEDVLRRHIRDGRILIGPWHILPDMFLVSPEAHIRNLLEGARTTRRFGPGMPVGYIPDPFGHPGQIPQILTGFGIEAAALWRGVGDLPTELWWESPDGSRVLLAYLRNGYGNGANLPVHDHELFTRQLAVAAKSLAAHSAVEDRLIMLGTDHMEPSAYTSGAIAFADAHLPDTKVIHSTVPAYVQAMAAQIAGREDSLPTIRGELRACGIAHLLPGVLSARMWIKQRNHHSETLLEKWAEPFSVFAENMIAEQPPLSSPDALASNRIRDVAPLLRQAWRLLMENHAHDSICGCSIDEVHDEMEVRFDQVDQIADEIILQALQALSRAVDTERDDAISAVVLFNPLGHPHRDLLQIDVDVPDDVAAFELVDADSRVIPHELVGSSNEVLANVLLSTHELRDTIGAINEGRVAGAAIVSVTVSRDGDTVTIDAMLDDEGQPNIAEWRQAEEQIARYETDPSVTHFHVLAHTPKASSIRFVSPEVPGLGWCTLWVRPAEAPPAAEAGGINPVLRRVLPLALRLAQTDLGERLLAILDRGDEGKPPFVIENGTFRVEAVRSDGTLTITDKRTNTVYARLNRLVDGGDAGDEYNYSPPETDKSYSPRVLSVKAFRDRLAPSLEIEYELRAPAGLSADRRSRSTKLVRIPVLSRITLPPGVPRIDIQTDVDNVAADHRLRVHFPAPVVVPEAHYDGHFEVVRRDMGVPRKGEGWLEDPRPEVPQRAFVDVSDGTVGLTVANRGLPEVEVLKGFEGTSTVIALTLLRCVGWLSRDDLPERQGHAGPALETPGGQMRGTWSFHYSVIPHAGDWRESHQQALAYQTGLRAVETGIHEGENPPQGAFIAPLPGGFVVSAVKATDDGSGWLMRGYNVSPETITLNVRPLRRFSRTEKVDLAEEEIALLSSADRGGVTLPVAGHKIVGVKFSGPLT